MNWSPFNAGEFKIPISLVQGGMGIGISIKMYGRSIFAVIRIA